MRGGLPRRLYWDSCSFLGLINQEPGKINNCRAVWTEAEYGDALIYTSFFTFAEVFKAKCEGQAKPLAEEQDKNMEQLLRQKWIRPVVVDERIGVAARRAMRLHPECKKPSDAIHLVNPFDQSDLLGLHERVNRADGKPLKICVPTPTPRLPPTVDLFTERLRDDRR